MLPNVPTADEQGLANLDTANWYGLFLPAVHRLNDAAVMALDTPSGGRHRRRVIGQQVRGQPFRPVRA
jgi:hypothetical protein